MTDSVDLLQTDHRKNRAVMGRISLVHRGVDVAEEGDTFEANGSTFEVTDVDQTTVGDLTIENARKEEATSVERLLGRIQVDYDDEMTEDDPVWIYHFARRPGL